MTALEQSQSDMENLAPHTDSSPEPSRAPVGRSEDAGSARARADGDEPDAGAPELTLGAPSERPPGPEPEALLLSGGVAAPAPKERILDTLQSVLKPSGIVDEFGDERIQVGPGQRELGLAGYPAQLGLFDGLGYALPDQVYDLVDRPRTRDPDQLAFAFPTGGVQMGFDEWHRDRDQALKWLSAQYPRGKTRKALRLRAKRGGECGRYVRQRICIAGHVEAKYFVASNCESRTCPASARADALELRSKLFAAVEQWPAKRRGQSWFFHTVTVRRPDWTSIQRLRVDRKRALAGWRAGWKIIRKLCGGKRAQLRVEVGSGGMVHVHILAYHRYILPKHLQLIREAILTTVGGGTTQYRVDRVGTGRGLKGGVKEVAKYVCKGVAMNGPTAMQTHPLMSALVETAFLRLPLAIEYGDWSGLRVADQEHEWHCSACGIEKFNWRYLDKRTDVFVLVEELGRGPPEKKAQL